MSTTIEAPEVQETETEVPVSPVVREAERLDRLFPNWHQRINESTLAIYDMRFCVLAQGAPHIHYNEAIGIVNAERMEEGINTMDRVYAGNEWLADWLHEIRKRKGNA